MLLFLCFVRLDGGNVAIGKQVSPIHQWIQFRFNGIHNGIGSGARAGTREKGKSRFIGLNPFPWLSAAASAMACVYLCAEEIEIRDMPESQRKGFSCRRRAAGEVKTASHRGLIAALCPHRKHTRIPIFGINHLRYWSLLSPHPGARNLVGGGQRRTRIRLQASRIASFFYSFGLVTLSTVRMRETLGL